MARLNVSGKFLLVVSGIWETFAWKSRILGFGIRNTAQGIQNPSSQQWNPDPVIRNPSLGLPYIGTINSSNYKITKIVRALWLAERSVCMRVYKHGCGVKLFGFSRANHPSTNLKSFGVQNSTSFLYFSPFLRQLTLGKSLQRRWVNFSSLKLTF